MDIDIFNTYYTNTTAWTGYITPNTTGVTTTATATDYNVIYSTSGGYTEYTPYSGPYRYDWPSSSQKIKPLRPKVKVNRDKLLDFIG